MKEQMQMIMNLLDDFLNQDIESKISNTRLTVKENKIHQEFMEKVYNLNKEALEIQNLMTNKYTNVDALDEYYLFVISDNKLKMAQYSTNYIIDELLVLEHLLKTYDLNILQNNVNKLYIVSDKTKEKYIKKASKKNKETIYDNYSLGMDMLNYVYDNSNMDLLGERYGIENHVLNKLTDIDNVDYKYILILNLDANGIELFNSVPYNLMQKGSAELEHEAVYRSTIEEFMSQEYIDAITNN